MLPGIIAVESLVADITGRIVWPAVSDSLSWAGVVDERGWVVATSLPLADSDELDALTDPPLTVVKLLIVLSGFEILSFQ